ncbi:DNA ligase D [Roseovarius sp.]|uniref:DNA ligase D n=1 Tax=Roseovarius sp. TaxID=1486281 RepID=UPI00356822F1
MSRLDTYRAKRDFARTSEPDSDVIAAGSNQPRFVVQKHDASRLHYDFRLEHDGVLLSWAVTRGPSGEPSEKRLAVRAEDHPLEYGVFEGTIPQGAYGGGTVMLWDQGWWQPLHDPAEGLAGGKLHFILHGARMQGGWVLVRLRGKARETRENWLLFKERDSHAGRRPDALLKRHRTSVTTGRTMRQIAAGKTVAALGEPTTGKHKTRTGKRPAFRAVQLATLRESPPEGAEWHHEAKFDGYRCLAALGRGGTRLLTRNGHDWTERFGGLASALEVLPCEAALLDGEVVAGQDGGDFSALQVAIKDGGALTLHLFDLLHLDGKDLTAKALTDRRRALETLCTRLPPRGAVRLSPVIEGDGDQVFAAICAAGGEGIISKRADAPYRKGRSKSWIKTKCIRRAEFVIVGWSPSDKRGRPFASLLLGSHENGRLVYRGRVGTGFDQAVFEDLTTAMAPLERKTPPVAGDLPSETRGAHWITPRLVTEISYAEFTAQGHIRHGVFLGLREDKPAMTVSASAEAASDGDTVTIAGTRISSPGRVVYPGTGETKGDVAEYYAMIADRFIKTAGHRPVSLFRCPDGIEGEGFYQKHAGKGFPDSIGRLPITEKDGDVADYIQLSSTGAVTGAVQMGTLEFHIWGSAADRLEQPDRMVFDLDPDEGLDFAATRKAALALREDLDSIGLPCAAMVTGGKGIHVIVPLRRSAEWETVKTFAQTFATVLAQRHPDRYTASMSKTRRKGRIFIDWLRNERGATAIAPYAMRARPGAPVATPVTWDELAGLKVANGFTSSMIAQRLSAPCPLRLPTPRSIGVTTIRALEGWAKG